MSYEFTKLSNVPAVSKFPEGANAIIETNGEIKRCPSSSGGSVPKPLTYDYMPEGYPKKSGWSIEWDGNTDGLVSVAGQFYKVSDMMPSDDELLGASLETSVGESIKLSSAEIAALSEDITVIGEGFAAIVRKDNATFNNFPFPQKGTYFSLASGVYTTRLSAQTITPMAEEFIPAGANSTTVFYL